MAETSPELARLEGMLLIRAYEEQLVALHRDGAPGTCTSVGQEACAVGVVQALDGRDRILTNHRSGGHLLARGADPGRLIAEVLGRVDGYCGGRSGSLHISAAELGVVLTSTIVGGELSMAPGVALAQKMGRGEPGGIVAVFFGDGAACEGVFHEALNLAVHWRLPLLFVCENNQWQAYVHRLETMSDRAISAWAEGHGLPVRVVDGNDVEAVHGAAADLVAGIRAQGGPAFLELSTYRQRGHFEPDDQAYVDPAECQAWLARDPIRRQAERLRAAGRLDAAGLAALEARVAARIAAALAFAQASPMPGPDTLDRHVYA
ncbi:thiamine pyrophosphate-dependent dehydrogenase E1 component subunit alpha [Parasulfuritortus cantonensis]|uniref:Thiamine pyrophosphate-dependent dehydrogenase E1 component subunit alpha n=1 Tax=Parasulfuritortus cantonensis TaxID=2528202 RepID=A0A4R1BD87_9PROT|nr:thiamine pyrophosphate-dependent dehydrogenase E1 component subunit alpha [Parasulfuritortus cantonensis]TCJ14977.1 thiamine pyrophosphate-dependent dehydrogenase E1 component subunit alpha [Parasulfuritortus cantonensis]